MSIRSKDDDDETGVQNLLEDIQQEATVIQPRSVLDDAFDAHTIVRLTPAVEKPSVKVSATPPQASSPPAETHTPKPLRMPPPLSIAPKPTAISPLARAVAEERMQPRTLVDEPPSQTQTDLTMPIVNPAPAVKPVPEPVNAAFVRTESLKTEIITTEPSKTKSGHAKVEPAKVETNKSSPPSVADDSGIRFDDPDDDRDADSKSKLLSKIPLKAIIALAAAACLIVLYIVMRGSPEEKTPNLASKSSARQTASDDGDKSAEPEAPQTGKPPAPKQESVAEQAAPLSPAAQININSLLTQFDDAFGRAQVRARPDAQAD